MKQFLQNGNIEIQEKRNKQNTIKHLLFFILFTTGLISTIHGAIIHSKTTGGNWNATATWVGGVIPVAGDDVVIDAVTATPVNVNAATAALASLTISDGALLTINQTVSCTNLIVGGGISGALSFPSTTARTLTASGNLTIATGGSVFVSGSNAISNIISVAGNFTNNGSFDGIGAGTNKLNVTFANSATNNTFSNAGATLTQFNLISLVKGAGNVLDFNPTASVVFPAAGYLTITSGIFKLNGSLTFSNPVFSGAAYSIPATGGFWLNNPNATVTAQNGSPTLAGTLRVSTGIFNIGTTNNSMGFSASATIIIEGGIVTSVARFGVAAAASNISYNQSGGIVYVNTLGGNSSSTLASFDMGTSTSTTFTMSGGTIILVNGSVNTEYRGPAIGATSAITSGTLQLGTAAIVATPTIAATPASTNFKITAVTPNLILNATNNPSVTASGAVVVKGDMILNGTGAYTSASLGLTLSGNSITNPGSINIAGANLSLTGTTILTFNGIFGNQSFNNTGTITSGGIPNLTINNTSASDTILLNTALSVTVALTLTNGIVKTTAVNLLKLGSNSAAGTLTGASSLSYIDGPIARTFAATSVTMNNTTLFPVGKNGLYLPVNLGPTITGVIQLQAEAFTTNAGSNFSPSGTISQHRWEASVITNSVNLTSILLKETDAAIAATNSILRSTTAAGIYQAITPASTYAVGPPATLLSTTALSNTEFTGSGYFCFGDACTTILSLTGPLNICINSISQLMSNAASGSWSTLSAAVATVDPLGNVTGVSSGTASIVFTSSVGFCTGLTVSKIITVNTCSVIPGGAGNNLISWYKGDAGLTTTLWSDIIGTNTVTASGSPSVTSSSLNFNPVATVGTSDSYSKATADGWLGTTSGTTYYYVAKLTASTISRAVYGRGAGSSSIISAHGGNRAGAVFASGAVNAIPQTGSWISPSINLSRGGFNGGAPGLYYVNSNGSTEVTGTSATPTIAGNGPFFIGRSVPAGNNWGGDIAEVIAYNGKQTSTDYKRVESYLAFKYGITLSQASAQDYIASDGTTPIWNATAAASGFNNNIFGIGTDNVSGLSQKVSASINSDNIVTLATINNFTLSNTDVSRTALSDLNFETITNNNGTNFWNFTGVISGGYCPLNRVWQVQETGMVDSVFVQFDVANVNFDVPYLVTGTSYFLLTDPNGDGNYSDGIAKGLTNTGGNLWSARIDFSHLSKFTLATLSNTINPGGVVGSSIWLRADAGVGLATGTPIGTWSDQSGSANDAIALTGSASFKPTFNDGTAANAMNYNPVATFNGGNQMQLNNSGALMGITGNNPLTMIVVSKQANFGRWFGATSGSYEIDVANLQLANLGTQTLMIYSTYPCNDSKQYLQSIVRTFTNTSNYFGYINADVSVVNTFAGYAPGTFTTYCIGGPSQYGPTFTGSTAEFLIFPSDLANDGSLLKVHSYLGLKYGITLKNNAGGSAGNYALSNGSSAWTASVTPAYQNNVIGIARDDVSALLQTQSHTLDDTTRIYLSTLATSNKANTGSFTSDLQSVIIGSDVGLLRAAPSTSAEIPTGLGIFSRLDREWKITNTSFNGTFSLDIKLNTSPVTASDLRILIDDDGDFTDATMYNPTITYAGGVATVSGLSTTQVPTNATKYFTIVSIKSTTPLPIELISFNGNCVDHHVLLNWATATEKNNALFIIEKSKDAISWTEMTRVNGSGTSTTLKYYSTTDNEMNESITYYRLDQVDMNSKNSYSPIISIENCLLNGGSQVNVYPNPFSNQITIEGAVSETRTIKVYTITGKDVTDLTKVISTDTTHVVLDASKLTGGIYMIRTSTTSHKIYKE